ncbi:polymerase III subunit alpha [Beggiatoa sp. PS]|nr:polymerase III subunit alpha [Beggiatoa sp. PS]
MARKLEGLTRNPGKHAGGVVIAPTVLTDFTPLYCEADGSDLMTQFDKGDVEAVGLVKFDFLGLRTLTIIKWALEMIHDSTDKKIDIAKIPLDDPETYDLFKRADTTAVFQLESSGIKSSFGNYAQIALMILWPWSLYIALVRYNLAWLMILLNANMEKNLNIHTPIWPQF